MKYQQSLSEADFFMGYSVPQNKELMRVFRDLDMVEQLGSGIPRILAHYPQSIYHFTPNFIRLVIPYAKGFERATEQASDQADKLITYCHEPRLVTEMMSHLGLKHRTYFRRKILKPLLDMGQLEFTIPDKPKSPNQRYITAHHGKRNI